MDAPSHFADTLVARIRELGHPLCVGLDPHLDRVPPLFRRGSMAPARPQTARAVAAFLCALVDRLEGRVAVVKPQSAFFERMGPYGIEALAQVAARARERGLLVLLDAKRGDVGSTAEGYAGAYLDPAGGLPVDALTVNPYLGLDTLEPFAAAATRHGTGFFVLTKTSNPGSGDLQDRIVDGEPVYACVARSLGGLAERLAGPETGWSSLGVVVGATYPEEALRVREALPRALFLVPGYGAQGASARDAVCAFPAGPRGREGGVVSSSRALLFPPGGDTDDGRTWERAVDAALARAVEELGEAVTR